MVEMCTRQILINAKLKTGKRGQETELTEKEVHNL
jgi:hypothetical protein